MLKLFSYLIYLVLKTINKLFYFLTNRNFINWINYFINLDAEKIITIKGKKSFIFYPKLSYRVEVRTFIDKEPDTIDWIMILTGKNIIFWDIGANILFIRFMPYYS